MSKGQINMHKAAAMGCKPNKVQNSMPSAVKKGCK